MREINSVLESVAIDVDPNEAVEWKRSNVKFFTEKGHHFSRNGIEFVDDESFIDVEGEDYDFFVCLPLTAMTMVDVQKVQKVQKE